MHTDSPSVRADGEGEPDEVKGLDERDEPDKAEEVGIDEADGQCPQRLIGTRADAARVAS